MTNDELSGQILGLLLSLCTVALFIVWLINTPSLIRYGITGVNVIIIAFWIVSSIRKKSKLRKSRASQIKDYVTNNKL